MNPIGLAEVNRRGMDAFAMLARSVHDLARAAGWRLEESADDLDAFTGAAFAVPSVGSVGLVQYRGQPDGTVTVMTSSSLSDLRKQRLLGQVLDAAKLTPKDVSWLKPPLELSEIPTSASGQRGPAARTRRRATLRRAVG